MHNIQALLDAGVRVSVKAPVLNLYYSELPQIKEIAEKFGIPFRTGFEIFPSIDNDDSVQQFSVPLADSLKYEFEEFAKRPRTFGEDYDVELVDLQKERPLFRCKLGRASCAPEYKCLSCKAYDFCDICPAMMQFVHGDLEYIDEHFCKSAKARYEHYIQGVDIDTIIENLK